MVTAKTERQWEVDSAARTLIEAEKIKADTSLFSAAQQEIAKQAAAAEAALVKIRPASFHVTVANR